MMVECDTIASSSTVIVDDDMVITLCICGGDEFSDVWLFVMEVPVVV